MRSRGLPVVDFGVVWKAACEKAGLEGGCSTTCDARRPATWTAPASPAMWPCRSPDTRPESMYRRYNIVTESDIRAALAKTQTYLDTLPITKG